MKTTSYEGKQVFIGLGVHREFFVAMWRGWQRRASMTELYESMTKKFW